MTRWTVERDRILRDTYPTEGLDAAAAAVGATRSAAKNRATALGLRRPSRAWTPEEDAVIRAGYGSATRAEEIARRIGRTVPATRRRAMLLGLTSGRWWTPAETEAIRAGYRTRGCAALAAELLGADTPAHRHAVYAAASKLGVTNPQCHPPEVYDRVRELHAQGLNDAEIARAMPGLLPGRNRRERVAFIRRRQLGLPTIGMSDEAKRECGRKTRAAQVAAGVNPRNLSHARLAARYGLPPDTPARAVEILVVLSSGPKTRAEIREVAGRDPVDLWNALGTSYLGGLVRRGLVADSKLPTCRGPRRLYFLTPAAMDLMAGANGG